MFVGAEKRTERLDFHIGNPALNGILYKQNLA
jgi:hypothetical protein